MDDLDLGLLWVADIDRFRFMKLDFGLFSAEVDKVLSGNLEGLGAPWNFLIEF